MPPETPPWRVKKAWRIPGSDCSDAACSMASSGTIAAEKGWTRGGHGRLLLEAGQFAELRVCHRDRFEQLAHAGALLAGQARERAVDLGVLGERRAFLERLGAGLDAEPAQERGLVDRAVHIGAQGLRGMPQRLEIDVRGEINGAGRLQRVGKGLPADRLEGVAGGALGVA